MSSPILTKKNREGKEVTASDIIAAKGKKAHGFVCWQDQQEVRLDFPQGEFVSVGEFKQLKESRAAENRRKNQDRFTRRSRFRFFGPQAAY